MKSIGPRPLHLITPKTSDVGALIIRIGFWGPLYYNYDKEPPEYYWYLLRPLH